jgi:UDP-N-acetyl-D-glucosamine dehydrogenase
VRKHDLGMATTPLSADAFAAFDAVVVSTAHDVFRDPALFERVALVVDTRNLVAPMFHGRAGRRPRIVKA